MEIPKAMVVERVRSRSGVDLDSDAELLRGLDLDPDELRDEFRGQSPNAG